MKKKEFLKQAKKLYKDQLEVENKFVSEMNFIFSDTEVLRVWFDVASSSYMHRFSKVQTLPSQADEKIEKELGRFIANDFEDYPAIIKALKRELPLCPNDIVDNILFSETDEDATIDPIQFLEFSLSVKELCDMIGLEA